MENINFFTPETHGKKLREKIPPKGGGFISSSIFVPVCCFFRIGIISTPQKEGQTIIPK
jgi:hypothetical protein